MSYSVHDFQAGDVLRASQLNEMDTQIALNEEASSSVVSSGVLADDYSATKTYAVGDYCFYNGNLYRCTTAITAAEGWNAEHWTEAELADDVTDLNRQLSDVAEGYLLFDIVRDSYITTTGVITSYPGWSRTDYIACDDYDTVEVEQPSGSASMYNVFYDENKAFISGSRFTVVSGVNTIAIPDNAAYFILSNATAAVENYKIRLNVTSVEIVGYTNPYYNLSAIGSMTVTFKFDSITFLINRQIITKTWNDLKTAIPGVYYTVDDAKMRDVGYTAGNRVKLFINILEFI